jgi:hypothetical protein
VRVAGLDLSLTGLGAVVVPGDWDLDFGRVARASFGVPLSERATEREITDRLTCLSHDITVWLEREKATHVYVESLPTGRAFNLGPLAELRGVVRVQLRRKLGLDVAIANQTSVRFLLLGALPKKIGSGAEAKTFNRKAAVQEALLASGSNFEDGDQGDAFAAANWGMAELGVPHLQELLFKFDAPKVKKPRAKKAVAA